MTVSSPQTKPAEMAGTPGNGAIPPLENGDRLTRAEFERRYQAMPGLKKAELIEGVVYMPSPVRYRGHSGPHGQIVTWLGYYAVNTPGVEYGDNGTVRLDLDSEPQPDALLRIPFQKGGHSRVTDDDYLEGAPELIAEVASSSVSYDLGVKLEVYRKNGVREYVVWRVLDKEIDWFVLRDDRFEPLTPTANGILRSAIFPGLWLDPAALLRGDLITVFDVLRQGLESDEHKAFVRDLEQARAE